MAIDCFREDALVLCMPEKYIPMALYQYHNMIMAGHQGPVRTLKTLSRKFFIPKAMPYIQKYIRTCQICQESETPRNMLTIFEIRVPVSFRPNDWMSMDIKDMMLCPKTAFAAILVATCEITNWVTAIPIRDMTTKTVFDVLYSRVVCHWGSPSAIISDKQSSFTSNMMTKLYKKLCIKPLYVTQENHGSNRTERYIQTLNKRIC